MHFTKMQGIGNDYVYVDCTKEAPADPSALAVAVSDRHFGIGSDGLILIKKSEIADFTMEMYNADGSRGKMCGNGIRCVGKYVYDHGLTDKTELTIETGAGLRELTLFPEKGKVRTVRVDMGPAIFSPAEIPVDPKYFANTSEDDGTVREVFFADFEVGGRIWLVFCVSMGNPHCVTFLDNRMAVEEFPLEKIGPLFEKHPAFPEGVNTEFAAIEDAHTIRMRVWERGSGETWACGTGASATAVAAIGAGWAMSPVRVRLNGGDLTIDWDGGSGHVFMTGPAEEVFSGEYEVSSCLDD